MSRLKAKLLWIYFLGSIGLFLLSFQVVQWNICSKEYVEINEHKEKLRNISHGSQLLHKLVHINQTGFHTVLISPVGKKEMEEDVRTLWRQTEWKNNWSETNKSLKLCPKIHHGNGNGSLYNESPEGLWYPVHCRPRHRIAILVPHKSRHKHLKYFIPFMMGHLQAQLVAFQILILEQEAPDIFNRGAILNAGFLAMMKLHKQFTCIIFHDVYLIPENKTLSYSCRVNPVHLGAYVNSSNYKLTPGITGSVLAITATQFQQVNGFSNIFWGWGGEDEDLYSRLQRRGITLELPDPRMSRFSMLPHDPDLHNPVIKHRAPHLLTDWTEDGLNSLQYHVTRSQQMAEYTHINVNIQTDTKTNQWLKKTFEDIKSEHQ